MKKFIVAVLSAVAALVLCFGLVACEIRLTLTLPPEEMAGTYSLLSFKADGKQYSSGDTYEGKQFSSSLATVRLNRLESATGEMLNATITCTIPKHSYYYVGNWSCGKGQIKMKGLVSESLSDTANQKTVTLTGKVTKAMAGEDFIVKLTINYNGVVLNLYKYFDFD